MLPATCRAPTVGWCQMSEIETMLRRLAARGYYEISPSSYNVPVDHPPYECEPGCLASHYETRRGIRLTWAPKGQASAGGDNRFNPFCTRAITRPTLMEALTEMLEMTTPDPSRVVPNG